MKKKNWLLIIIILFAALLIATVIWIYAKRIEHIESKMKSQLFLPVRNYCYRYGRRQAEVISRSLHDSSTGKI
jgi:hypothetical protein